MWPGICFLWGLLKSDGLHLLPKRGWGLGCGGERSSSYFFIGFLIALDWSDTGWMQAKQVFLVGEDACSVFSCSENFSILNKSAFGYFLIRWRLTAEHASTRLCHPCKLFTYKQQKKNHPRQLCFLFSFCSLPSNCFCETLKTHLSYFIFLQGLKSLHCVQ